MRKFNNNNQPNNRYPLIINNILTIMATIISKVITNSLMVINIQMVAINNPRKSLKNPFIKNGGSG